MQYGSQSTTGESLLAAEARSDRMVNFIIIIYCLCIIAGSLILAPPEQHSSNLRLGALYVPSTCSFRNLTGIPCPGCGLTRSMVAVAHGDLDAGFYYNRLGPLVLAYILLQLMYRFIRLALPTKQLFINRFGRYLNRGIAILCVLFLINWISTLVSYFRIA